MNELIPPKSNAKKWLLPGIIAVIALVLFLVTGTASALMEMSQIYKDPEIYENALRKANENPAVIAKLGKLDAIDEIAILEGNVVYTDKNNSVSATLRVKGMLNKGKMDILAEKKGGKWRYKQIRIRIKNPEQTITVVE